MMEMSKYSKDILLYRMVESDIRLIDQILSETLDNFKLPLLLVYNDGVFKPIPK